MFQLRISVISNRVTLETGLLHNSNPGLFDQLVRLNGIKSPAVRDDVLGVQNIVWGDIRHVSPHVDLLNCFSR
jgi:hypothetical protein